MPLTSSGTAGLSFLGEYIVHSRELTDGTTTARSTQHAFMLMASYYLTGERDYAGNGIQGFSSVEPIRPFLPSRGQWGPGAWQVAAQWSQFDVGRGDFNRGFIDSTLYTNRASQLMLGVNWWPVKNTRSARLGLERLQQPDSVHRRQSTLILQHPLVPLCHVLLRKKRRGRFDR